MENTKGRSVIVLGRTGCGKSTFIRAMMLDGNLSKANVQAATNRGLKLPEVSASIKSCTQKVDAYSIPAINGEPYALLDCMGLQDTNKNDKEAVQQMAKVLSHLTSLVGIVYIIDGRVTPSEANNCKYVFNELLADVKPADVLIIRSKHDEWDEYDAREEKRYLKSGIPSTLSEAAWVAVNFNKQNQPDEGRRQVELVKERLSRWTQPLQLSDKTKIACNYMPDYLQLLKDKENLAQKEKELEHLKEDFNKMQLTVHAQNKEAAQHQAKIKEVQETVDKLITAVVDKSFIEKLIFNLSAFFSKLFSKIL